MFNLLNIISIIGSNEFLISVESISLIVKLSLFTIIIFQGIRATKIPKPFFFLLGTLVGSIFGSIAWITGLLPEVTSITIPPPVYNAILGISWAFVVVQYQSLVLFIESLTEKEYTLSPLKKFFVGLSGLICLYYVYLIIFDQGGLIQPTFKKTAFYALSLVLPSIFLAIQKIRSQQLPRILKKQLTIFIPYIICAWVFFDFVQLNMPYFLSKTSYYYQDAVQTFSSFSTIFLTYAIYYCTRKMSGLRFLNFQDHVASIKKNMFIDSFKHVLEQFGHATTIKELNHITQTFFKEAFGIPLGRTHLYVRSVKPHKDQLVSQEIGRVESVVETFVAAHSTEAQEFMRNTKIIIHDELAFSNFYKTSQYAQTMLSFLENVNADVFLPIYEKKALIGYIIVERFARHDHFYTNVERDEMLVLTNYLGNLINLIENRNFESLIQQEKTLKEELYSKHQEINQYKESVRSFLRNPKQKSIGIIFYKNRRFTYGNQTAKELIKINLNIQEGHSLTKIFKQVAHDVEQYKTAQLAFAKDTEGNKIILSGVPSIEHNSIIITVYYPEIADIVKRQIDLLKDPTKWDYLLYLETTKSGQLINQLIPGSGETLLNFKINLLETALSNKATLLEMNEKDLVPTVELLHHLSLREQLHVFKLHEQHNNVDIAIKLFGINPIFKESSGQPLLQKLHDTGTLFIQNVEYLDLETQNYLAEFIRYGYYRIFKSDTKVPSNVRIICSTNRDLQTMVHDGTFSQALFNELKKTSLSMPSLLTLPQHELRELTDGFTEQTVQTHELKNLLELTERERSKIAHQRPVSLHELRSKVQQLITQKSKKNQIYEETEFNPAYEISDPQLIEAARLGKHALRDRKIMTLLWDKFKSQSKIATFLGVNRSSINRRCKEYNLQ